MLKTKKRIGTFSLIMSIILLVTIVVFIFGEILSFTSYINGKGDAGWEGLGILGIIAFAIFASVALVVFAVPTLIFSIMIMKKDKLKTLKTMSILSAIFQFLGAAVVIVFAILMICSYPDYLTIWYIPVAILTIVSGISALVGCKKFKEQPQA